MKIVVFDDDPTGSQTVYGCPLLFQWNKEILTKWIKDSSPLLFLLTNTRSLSPENAEYRLREVCENLKEVLKENDLRLNQILFVSRGDSTLRGHSTLEPKVINEELGPFDATFHVPAFFEGGRTTVNGIHLLNSIPVHKTIFGEDKIFGFSSSNLATYLEEKSNFKIKSKDVICINIKQLREANKYKLGMKRLTDLLLKLSSNQTVIVDAQSSIDLDTFVSAIEALGTSKKFLFRSAASLINSLSKIYPEKNTIKNFSNLRLRDKNGSVKPGIVIVGSHVKLADKQLELLLEHPTCIGIKLPVKKISRIFQSSEQDRLIADLENLWNQELLGILDKKMTPVLFTSRGEILFSSMKERLGFGVFLAALMGRLVDKISSSLGYIISKGGITTHYLISKGLRLQSVYLHGQILPGLSVVCTSEKDKEKLPIITFPGNLGDKTTLLKAFTLMESV